MPTWRVSLLGYSKDSGKEMAHTAVVSVVDDDESVRLALDSLLRSNGYTVQLFATAEAFLACPAAQNSRCLISELTMEI